MSSKRTSSTLVLTLVVLFLAIPGQALSDQGIVIVESELATAPPGTVLTLNDTIKIPAGAEIRFVDESGKTLKVRGPFEGTVSAARAASHADLKQENNSLGDSLDLLNQTTGTGAGAVR